MGLTQPTTFVSPKRKEAGQFGDHPKMKVGVKNVENLCDISYGWSFEYVFGCKTLRKEAKHSALQSLRLPR